MPFEFLCLLLPSPHFFIFLWMSSFSEGLLTSLAFFPWRRCLPFSELSLQSFAFGSRGLKLCVGGPQPPVPIVFPQWSLFPCSYLFSRTLRVRPSYVTDLAGVCVFSAILLLLARPGRVPFLCVSRCSLASTLFLHAPKMDDPGLPVRPPPPRCPVETPSSSP